MVFSNMGIIYKICKLYADGEDREDLKQEIIYQLWLSYPTYRGDSKFQSWMYRVALNTAMLGLRARKMNYTGLTDQELKTSEDQREAQKKLTHSKLKVMKRDELIHMWQEGNDRMFMSELTDKDMITKYLGEKTLKGNRSIVFNLIFYGAIQLANIILLSMNLAANLNLYVDNDNGTYVINNKVMFVVVTLMAFLIIYGAQKATSMLGLRKLKAYLSDLQQGVLDSSQGMERFKKRYLWLWIAVFLLLAAALVFGILTALK